MSDALSAADLLPLVLKLAPEERRKLISLLLRASTPAGEAAAYSAFPPSPDEFSLADDPFASDSDDWSEFADHGK